MTDEVKMEIAIYDDGAEQEKPLYKRMLEMERELKDEDSPRFTEKPWFWSEKTGKIEINLEGDVT